MIVHPGCQVKKLHQCCFSMYMYEKINKGGDESTSKGKMREVT